MKSVNLEKIALALTAAVSLLLSGAALVSMVLLGVLLSEVTALPLQAQTSPAVALAAATTKEQVDGDLKTAIAEYQKIAADKSAPRDVRAKALLHLAGCYEKLGQQAQGVYQQIVRDFADQPAAAQARTRLATLKQNEHPAPPAAITQRKIEASGRQFGEGDTDGQRVVYADRATSELIYGDLAGNSKKVIFKAKPGELPGWSPSRDFSMVFLSLHSKPDQPHTFAVINTDGTGYREFAHLDANSNCWPNWSWDNRYLVCAESKDKETRLLRISVADGQTRELLNLKDAYVEDAHFSPDGRFIAYEAYATSDTDPFSRIFVMPAEGGEPQLVYEKRQTDTFFILFEQLRLLDWTADGRYLAIGIDKGGKGALDLLPMKDGKAAGDPAFVKYGDFRDAQTTTTGGLIYHAVKPGGAWAVYLASLDANGHPGDWKRLDLPLGNISNPMPAWSGDSNRIVYVAKSEDEGQVGGGGEVVHLRNLSTGDDRTIYHAQGMVMCIWAAQQPKLFCSDKADQTTEIVSIAADSGEITRLHSFSGKGVWIDYPSHDNQSLYIVRGPETGGAQMVRWDIASQQETLIDQYPDKAWGEMSSDERWLIRVNGTGVEIRPISGGDWKPLVSRLNQGGHVDFTADGTWLLYHDADSTGKPILSRVASAGGQPERLGDFPTNAPSGTMRISPDGSKVMVAAGEYGTAYEMWSLENFVPLAPKP
jgi:Tol biopolymer transport system component